MLLSILPGHQETKYVATKLQIKMISNYNRIFCFRSVSTIKLLLLTFNYKKYPTLKQTVSKR